MCRLLDLLPQDLLSDCGMETKQDLSVTSSNADFSSLLIFISPSLSCCLQPTVASTVCRKLRVEWVFSPWCATQKHTMFFPLKFDNSIISASTRRSKSFCQKLWPSCYMLCNWFAGQLARAASEPTVLSCAAWHGRYSSILPSGSDLSHSTQLGIHKFFFTLLQVLLEKMDSVQIWQMLNISWLPFIYLSLWTCHAGIIFNLILLLPASPALNRGLHTCDL